MNAKSRFWLITVATLLSVLATMSLGRWQLSRAAQKEALQAATQTQGRLPALDGRSWLAMSDLAQTLQRRVQVRGVWVPEATVFLDNRQMNGTPGFYVVTPLRLEGGDAVVLVQRGWVQRNFAERSSLPVLNTPAGLVDVRGRISPPPAKLYELGESQGGAIRQNLDVSQFNRETGLGLMALSIQQTDAAPDGLLRDWPLAASGVDKHLGYAFQWFGLSALLVVLYVWFQIVRKFFPPS